MSSFWMTDELVSVQKCLETTAALIFLVFMIGIILAAYIAKRYFESILVSMRNSHWVVSESRFYESWAFERQCRFVMNVAAMVRRPAKRLIESGEISREDIQNFPSTLKRLLCIQDFLVSNSFWACAVILIVLEAIDYVA